MLELLNPKRVAARKLARMIAQKQPAKPAPEAEGRHIEAATAAGQFDALERLLDEELGKYGLRL